MSSRSDPHIRHSSLLLGSSFLLRLRGGSHLLLRPQWRHAAPQSLSATIPSSTLPVVDNRHYISTSCHHRLLDLDLRIKYKIINFRILVEYLAPRLELSFCSLRAPPDPNQSIAVCPHLVAYPDSGLLSRPRILDARHQGILHLQFPKSCTEKYGQRREHRWMGQGWRDWRLLWYRDWHHRHLPRRQGHRCISKMAHRDQDGKDGKVLRRQEHGIWGGRAGDSASVGEVKTVDDMMWTLVALSLTPSTSESFCSTLSASRIS